MLIQIGFDMEFEVPARTPLLSLLYVHPERAHLLRCPEKLRTEPAIPVEDFTDVFGNRCARLVAPAGKLRLWSENVIEDTGEPEPEFPDAVQHLVEELPQDVLQFLLPSRYCESDCLSDTAWSLFGSSPAGWGRVQAVCDWVHANVEFGYSYASPTKTALNVYSDRKGVCRDFMHLALTFCRALNIPARYATGYLGDIGVPPAPDPMDFSAFFEVYLSGQWHAFDPRHNERRIGRVLMARGRDAADVALTTSFGAMPLTHFAVTTDEVPESQIVPPAIHTVR